jgi:hypothetical protein
MEAGECVTIDINNQDSAAPLTERSKKDAATAMAKSFMKKAAKGANIAGHVVGEKMSQAAHAAREAEIGAKVKATVEKLKEKKVGETYGTKPEGQKEANSSNEIYLDYNATTPILRDVGNAMTPYIFEIHGNPSSGHSHGKNGAPWTPPHVSLCVCPCACVCFYVV